MIILIAFLWYYFDMPQLEPIIIILTSLMVIINLFYKNITLYINKIKHSSINIKKSPSDDIKIENVENSYINIDND